AAILDDSDYLRELLMREPALVAETLRAEPGGRLDALLDAAAAECRAGEDMDAVMRCLRHCKEQAALLIALCDLGGLWTVEEVTAALSRVAVRALGISLDWLLTQAWRAGRFNPPDPDHPQAGSGLIVL